MGDSNSSINTSSSNDNSSLNRAINAINDLRSKENEDNLLRVEYSKLRSAREKATFAMMMRMNPTALQRIRKEFFTREDSVVLDEFIYIIQKHLMSHVKEPNDGSATNNGNDHDNTNATAHTAETTAASEEEREFLANMYDLFKDIDVNGDGDLEWEEFTSFAVEKANQLTKRLQLASISPYQESTNTLDASADYRHRNDISSFCNIPTQGLFSLIEDHKNAIYLFNSRFGRHVHTIQTDSAPIAMAHVAEKDMLVASNSDMTMTTYLLNDPHSSVKFRKTSQWTTPSVQLALTYMEDNHLLYSGATNSNVYSWKIANRSLVNTFTGHSDIVMGLVGLKKLHNIASCSLDKSVILWDTYTSEKILRLYGHTKGICDIAYSEEYRLLVSCGFEHDACIWSPFVKSLVYRLKGHGSSLVGCATIPNTPEIITADISGQFRLWDIRNFQCVQIFSKAQTDTFQAPDSTKLSAFFSSVLPPRHEMQKENDSRIYASAKNIFSFDQVRVVHGATTDFSNIQWLAWNSESLSFITASERNIIVWDALIGSKTITNTNIINGEICACCLDDRKRKMIIGDTKGVIAVYNHLSGNIMKTVQNFDNSSAVISLAYVDSSRRFIAGFSNGVIRVYDENSMDDCVLIRSFDAYDKHPELLTLSFNPIEESVVSVATASDKFRVWDYASGKVEADIQACDNHEHIVSLTYLHPYPIIATSDSKGNIVLWTSRLCRKRPLNRICGFMNCNPVTAIAEERKRLRNINEDDPPVRILPDPACPIYDITDYVSNQSDDTPESSDDESESDLMAAFDLGMLSPNNSSSIAESVNFSLDSTHDIRDWQERMILVKQAKHELLLSEEKWGKTTPAQCLDWDDRSFLLFTGDDFGNLRCFSVKNAILDVGGTRLRDDVGKHLNIYYQCKQLERLGGRSACPPVSEHALRFLVGGKYNAMSYLGVDFNWSIEAHDDRIITCKVTPDGVLTSGADMLVKMWNHDGVPMGCLLQSVPVGIKGRGWKLPIDVRSIIEKENTELDNIIDDVSKLASNVDELPDIDTYDFTGIEPGAHAAEFSRSELRQRIEKTRVILGIDFKTESNDDADADDAFDDHSTSTKSVKAALKDLKSADVSGGLSADHNAKTSSMTLLQSKQHSIKMEQVSHMFERKTGIDLHSAQREVKKYELDEEEEKSVTSMSGIDISRHRRHAKVQKPKEESDDVSIQSSLTVGNDNAAAAVAVTNKRHTGSSSLRKTVTAGTTRTSVFNTPLEPSGDRGDSIAKTCGKFSAYNRLNDALRLTIGPGTSNAAGGRTSSLTAEQLEKLKSRRMGKYGQTLIDSSTTNSSYK